MSELTSEQVEKKSEEFKVKLEHLCEQFDVSYIGSFMVNSKGEHTGCAGIVSINGISHEKILNILEVTKDSMTNLVTELVERQDAQ